MWKESVLSDFAMRREQKMLVPGCMRETNGLVLEQSIRSRTPSNAKIMINTFSHFITHADQSRVKRYPFALRGGVRRTAHTGQKLRVYFVALLNGCVEKLPKLPNNLCDHFIESRRGFICSAMHSKIMAVLAVLTQ